MSSSPLGAPVQSKSQARAEYSYAGVKHSFDWCNLGRPTQGGRLVTRPTIVVEGTMFHLLVVADDSSVYYAEIPLSALSSATARLNWVRIEGTTAFPVSAVLSAPNVLDVFARAPDGSTHWKRRKNSVWGRILGGKFEENRWGWTALRLRERSSLAERIVPFDRPVAVSPWPGRIDLFVNKGDEFGKQPFVNTWDEARMVWGGFKPMPGSPLCQRA